MRLLLLVLVLSTAFWGCVDEISFTPQIEPPRVVIQGNITTQPPPYQITVKETGQFAAGGAGAQQPITTANVRITDDLGAVIEFTYQGEGIYESVGAAQGEAGRTYTLEVAIGTAVYRSTPQTIHPVPAIEELSFQKTVEQYIVEGTDVLSDQSVMKVFASTRLPDNEAAYLKWDVSGEYEFQEVTSQSNLSADICYIKEAINYDNISIFGTEPAPERLLQGQLVITKPIDYRFAKKYCFHVTQSSLTREAYEFWATIKNELNRTGSIFETPPAKIRGNLANVNDPLEDVAGFFYASDVVLRRLFVNFYDAGAPRPLCRPFPTPPESCYNCLLRANSTQTMPSYWE